MEEWNYLEEAKLNLRIWSWVSLAGVCQVNVLPNSWLVTISQSRCVPRAHPAVFYNDFTIWHPPRSTKAPTDPKVTNLRQEPTTIQLCSPKESSAFTGSPLISCSCSAYFVDPGDRTGGGRLEHGTFYLRCQACWCLPVAQRTCEGKKKEKENMKCDAAENKHISHRSFTTSFAVAANFSGI